MSASTSLNFTGKGRKRMLLVLEIILILAAVVFIYPTIFVFNNAFKTTVGINLYPTSFPSGSFEKTMEDLVKDNPKDFLKYIRSDEPSLDAFLTTKAVDLAAYLKANPLEARIFAKTLGGEVQGDSKVSFKSTFTLDNFPKAWEQTRFPWVLLNTFIITIFSVLGVVIISSTASYMLVRTTGKRTGWLFYSLFTFALVIPFQVIMVPLVVQSVDMGLTSMGKLVRNPQELSMILKSLGIVPMYWGLGVPTAVFMYHGFIKGVPLALEESAYLDGASVYQVFWKIVFPMLTPITATVVILDVLWIWNDFLLPLIIIQEGTLQLAQFRFFGMFFRDYGPAMASLVLSASPVLLFYLALQRFIIKGISAGAVKG